MINLEKKIINVLKLQRLITTICTLAALILTYSLAKVHEPVTDQRPSLRPILLVTSYKFLVSLVTPLTSNHYTIKDSFLLVGELSSFVCARYMISFDITSLFTNIPSRVTISICVDKCLKIKIKVTHSIKESFRYLLEFIFLILSFQIF